MKIQTLTFAPVKPLTANDLCKFVADPTHNVAWPSSLAGQVGLAHKGTFKTVSGLQLHTASLSSVTPAMGPDLAKSLGQIGELSTELLKQQYPTGRANLALEGVELLLAGKEAFDAWTDPDRKVVLTALTTGKVLLELTDVLKPLVPALGKIAPQLEVISFLLNVSGQVYQVQAEFRNHR